MPRKTVLTWQSRRIEYEEVDASRSGPILDEIDAVLAKHHGVSEETLEFIITHDNRYRPGRDAAGKED